MSRLLAVPLHGNDVATIVVVINAAVGGYLSVRYDGGAAAVSVQVFTILQDPTILACM
jgi:hypothetical protein